MVVSIFFWKFYPETWGNDPIWRAYFSNGLVKNHQLEKHWRPWLPSITNRQLQGVGLSWWSQWKSGVRGSNFGSRHFQGEISRFRGWKSENLSKNIYDFFFNGQQYWFQYLIAIKTKIARWWEKNHQIFRTFFVLRSIVSCRMAGFQPLAAGRKLWTNLFGPFFWWFRNPANSPVEVGSWNPMIIQGFYTSFWWLLTGFL